LVRPQVASREPVRDGSDQNCESSIGTSQQPISP
jgi:hypothetical protein